MKEALGGGAAEGDNEGETKLFAAAKGEGGKTKLLLSVKSQGTELVWAKIRQRGSRVPGIEVETKNLTSEVT